MPYPKQKNSNGTIDDLVQRDTGNGFDAGLLHRIPRTARLVLEIGCGTGALGAAYKRLNPACLYHGVERDSAAAKIARTHLDRVTVVDLEALDPAAMTSVAQSDVVILNGVLEHVGDPARVVAGFGKCLADGGVIIVVFPNVGHWSVLRDLMAGRWRPEPAATGIPLPRQHFTLDSMADLFRDVGLIPYSAVPQVAKGADTQAFHTALGPAVEALGLDRNAFEQRTAANRYLVTAGPQSAKPLLIQGMMLRPVGACNDVRVELPGRALASEPGVTFLAQVRNAALSVGNRFTDKVFLWQRPVMTYAADGPTIKALLARGYVIVIEFDDHPNRWPVVAENDYLTYRAGHGVQTSTEPLADLYRCYNPEVAVFPNAVDDLPPLVVDNRGDEVRLFFGALNRADDWAPLMPALNRAIAARRDRVSVTVVHDRGFFEALEIPRKSFTPTCDYATYRRLLGESDICLMPLEDNEFNRMKSDLKFIEAAAHGAVALASPVVYSDTLEGGRTGVLFRDAGEFEAALCRLLDEPAHRESLARAAHAYVARERMLSGQVEARITWYRSLIARREELTAKLLERVPALRG